MNTRGCYAILDCLVEWDYKRISRIRIFAVEGKFSEKPLKKASFFEMTFGWKVKVKKCLQMLKKCLKWKQNWKKFFFHIKLKFLGVGREKSKTLKEIFFHTNTWILGVGREKSKTFLFNFLEQPMFRCSLLLLLLLLRGGGQSVANTKRLSLTESQLMFSFSITPLNKLEISYN